MGEDVYIWPESYDLTGLGAYLLVKRHEALYREYAAELGSSTWTVYAVPVLGTEPPADGVRYRGLDREPLWGLAPRKYGNAPAQSAAEIRMGELETERRTAGASIFSHDDMREVLRWAEEERPGVYEPVWARVQGTDAAPPEGYAKRGYEPNYFPQEWFSPIADCMFFPRWHGTDDEGTLFLDHFKRLNAYGLFDTSEAATGFLDYYLSFDWTETGEYSITEVWLPKQ